MQGLHQLFHFHIFEDIRDSPCLQSREDMRIFVVGGQHNYLGAWTDLFDMTCCLDAVHARHDQVQQDNVRNQFCYQIDPLLS